MKLLNITLQTVKYILATLIALLALATFMGQNYVQTVCLVLTGIILVYWPLIIDKRIGENLSITVRIVSCVLFFVLAFTVFSPGPKTTIYTSF